MPSTPHIPHEKDTRDVIDDQLKRTSSQAHIPNASVAAGATPTKAEYDVLVGKFNSVLQTLRDADLLPSS
jgi:hypothetical protein